MMSALSGIYSFQDVMSNNLQTKQSLNPNRLELGAVKQVPSATALPNHPPCPRYHQDVRYGGVKLFIQTSQIKRNYLRFDKSFLGVAVLIPIDSWLRQQLDIIDNFVRNHVDIPKDLLSVWPYQRQCFYKPFHDSQNMYIDLGLYCKFTQGTGTDYKILPENPLPEFGKGTYTFSIEVPKVYIGPHKDGSLVSMNIRVVHIHYEPETFDVNDLFTSCVGNVNHAYVPDDTLENDCPTEKPVKPKRRRKIVEK